MEIPVFENVLRHDALSATAAAATSSDNSLTPESIKLNAIVQAYSSIDDTYTNAVIVDITKRGTCVVDMLGLHEKVEAEVQALRPAVLHTAFSMPVTAKCSWVCV